MPPEVQTCHRHADDKYTNPESYIHPFQNSCFESSAGPLACARCASGLGACHCGFRWPAGVAQVFLFAEDVLFGV